MEGQGRRLFVERVRIDGVIREAKSDQMLLKGNEVVLSGRREFVIGEEDWIGDEVNDIELLDFPAETLPVLISRKEYAGMTVLNYANYQLCTVSASRASNVLVSTFRF